MRPLKKKKADVSSAVDYTEEVKFHSFRERYSREATSTFERFRNSRRRGIFTSSHENPNLMTSMIAGASAGVVVDIALFPLDTIKTRLQSKQGLFRTGGFVGVYKGLLPVLLGSAPTSAIFFMTYNSLVNRWKAKYDQVWDSFIHIGAASCAEVAGATLRVPIEVIKQRKQVSSNYTTNLDIIRWALKAEGISGLYRGFLSTLTREVPFAALQLPLWEYLKSDYSARYLNGKECSPVQAAYCGALSGGVAAALTTPMDVVKTRVMLADKYTVEKALKEEHHSLNRYIITQIYNESGWKGFFKGVSMRVLWIASGGFIYFGAYDQARQFLEEVTVLPKTFRMSLIKKLVK